MSYAFDMRLSHEQQFAKASMDEIYTAFGFSTYYILIRDGRVGGYGEPFRTVYVKGGEFFKSQGGLTEDWGKNWIPVKAKDIEHARLIGQNYRL